MMRYMLPLFLVLAGCAAGEKQAAQSDTKAVSASYTAPVRMGAGDTLGRQLRHQQAPALANQNDAPKPNLADIDRN